jgi:hypothetical protein
MRAVGLRDTRIAPASVSLHDEVKSTDARSGVAVRRVGRPDRSSLGGRNRLANHAAVYLAANYSTVFLPVPIAFNC